MVWRSPKSVAQVIIALSLVCHFLKGTSCRGKYALFVLVWFGGPINQLQRSPLHCPWCGIFKKVYHVGVNMHYLVWFGGHPNQLQSSPLQCPWSGIFKKVYHAGVNISLVNLLQIALPITGQWVTDNESINPISGRGGFSTPRYHKSALRPPK